MTDLGIGILENAEPLILVFDLVLQLKIVVQLCKWNKHKNHEKDHAYFVWVLLSSYFSEKESETGGSSWPARLMLFFFFGENCLACFRKN